MPEESVEMPHEQASDAGTSNSFPLTEASGGQQPIDESYPFIEAAGSAPATVVKAKTQIQEKLRAKFPLQEIVFPDGKVVYRDMRPAIPNSDHDEPVISMVGAFGDQKDVGDTMAGVVAGGEHVITLDFEGKGRRVKGEDGYSRELNRQAKLLGQFIEKMPQTKVKLVGHSMATIRIVSMLKHMPHLRTRVDGVIVISPMGLGGKDNAVSIVRRRLKENEKAKDFSDEQKEKEAIYGEQAKNFMLNNIERTVREVVGMGGADIYDDFQRLHEWGIPAVIIQGDTDELNASQRIWKNIAEKSVGGNRWGQPSLIRPEKTKKPNISEYLVDLAEQAERASEIAERVKKASEMGEDIQIAEEDLPRKGKRPIRAKDLTPEEAGIAKQFIDRELAITQKARERGDYPTVPISMVGGGHEIYANDRMSGIILDAIKKIRAKNVGKAQLADVREEFASEAPLEPPVSEA